MKTLTAIREKLIRFYNRSDVYLLPVLKFALSFFLFWGINANYGYMQSINKIFVVAVLALVCALLPLGGTVAIGIILIVIHCFGLGAEIGAIAAGLYLLLFILILRFIPHDALGILLTPFAFRFGVQAAVPVSMGMLGKASSAVTAVCSIISFFFLKQLPVIESLKETGDLSNLEIVKSVINSIVGNTEMIMYAIIFAAVVMIVYLIRKLCTTYGWLISILTGTAVYIVLVMCGSAFLELDFDLMKHVIGSIISVLISLVIAFFKFNANYKGASYLQFEDDDYYYYVKAIPKNKASIDENDDYSDDEDEDEDEYYDEDDEDEEYEE